MAAFDQNQTDRKESYSQTVSGESMNKEPYLLEPTKLLPFSPKQYLEMAMTLLLVWYLTFSFFLKHKLGLFQFCSHWCKYKLNDGEGQKVTSWWKTVSGSLGISSSTSKAVRNIDTVYRNKVVSGNVSVFFCFGWGILFSKIPFILNDWLDKYNPYNNHKSCSWTW